MSVDVKLYFQLPSGSSVAHRWLLPESSLFDSLRERLEALCVSMDPRLNCTPLRLSVSYDDGEDWCTLSGPRSLAEALATTRELNRRPLKLRAAVAKAGDVAFSRESEAGSTGARERAMSDASLFSDFSSHSLASHVADMPPSPSMKASLAPEEEEAEEAEQRPPPVEIEDEKSDEQPEAALLTPNSAGSDALLVDAADGHASDDEYVRIEDEQHESAGSSLSSSHGSQSASAHLQAPLALEPPSCTSSGPFFAPSSATSSMDLGVQTSGVESASLGTSTDELRQSTEFSTQTTAARQATPIPTQTEDDDAESADTSASVQVDEEAAPAQSASAAPHVDETAAPPAPFEISDVTGHAVPETDLAGSSPEPRITQPAQEAEAQIDDVTGFHEHVATQEHSDSSDNRVTVEDELEEQEEEQKEQSVPEPQKPQASSTSSSSSSSASAGTIHRGITCDGCGQSPLTGVRYHCTMCVNPGGFDLCEQCETSGDKHPHTHVMLKMRRPAHIRVGALRHFVEHATRGTGGAGRGSWRSAAPPVTEKPKATFISDVTLGDDVTVHAGETLRKVWSIQNSGRAPWPQPTRLVFVGGDLEPSSAAVSADRQCATVPFAGPGDVVHVSLDLVVPDEPGRFRSTFRLQAPDGTRFGPRVWISLVVPQPEPEHTQKEEPKKEQPQQKTAPVAPPEAASSSSIAAPASQPSSPPKPRAVPPFPYGNQLAQLRSMGFSDSELCRYLLLNNQGDVQKVVAWLLNNTI